MTRALWFGVGRRGRAGETRGAPGAGAGLRSTATGPPPAAALEAGVRRHRRTARRPARRRSSARRDLNNRAGPVDGARDHLPRLRGGAGAGARRRGPGLKVHAKARAGRGVDREVIRDGGAICAATVTLAAARGHEAVLAWRSAHVW